MKKSKLIEGVTKSLWLIENYPEIFYCVCVGIPRIVRGKLDNKNLLFKSNKINEVMDFWNGKNKGGKE